MQNGVQLELMQPVSGYSIYNEYLEQNKGALNASPFEHFALLDYFAPRDHHENYPRPSRAPLFAPGGLPKLIYATVTHNPQLSYAIP